MVKKNRCSNRGTSVDNQQIGCVRLLCAGVRGGEKDEEELPNERCETLTARVAEMQSAAP